MRDDQMPCQRESLVLHPWESLRGGSQNKVAQSEGVQVPGLQQVSSDQIEAGMSFEVPSPMPTPPFIEGEDIEGDDDE